MHIWGGVYGNFPKAEPQYRPYNTIILIMGTPKQAPPIWGTPHIGGELGCRGVSLRARRDSTRPLQKGFPKTSGGFLSGPHKQFHSMFRAYIGFPNLGNYNIMVVGNSFFFKMPGMTRVFPAYFILIDTGSP